MPNNFCRSLNGDIIIVKILLSKVLIRKKYLNITEFFIIYCKSSDIGVFAV